MACSNKKENYYNQQPMLGNL